MEPIVLFLAGVLFFPLIYDLLSRALRSFFGHKLTPADISTISVKCVSSIQAMLSSTTGAVIVSSCVDIMHDRHWLTNSYAYFGVSYFYYDVWAMYHAYVLNHRGSLPPDTYSRLKQFMGKEKTLMIHHIAMPLIFLPIILFLRQDRGDFFVGVFYMIELTVPFISARAIMVQLNLKSSPWYIVVGLLMIVAFTITRILVFPFLYLSYAGYASLPVWAVPGSIPLKCNLGCLLLLLPQLYWWFLMVRGACRVFRRLFAGPHSGPSPTLPPTSLWSDSSNHNHHQLSHRAVSNSKQC